MPTLTLNENQIEILLPLFQDSHYPGASNIGRKLLQNGKCIVAGDSCIWEGGVGNFITVTEPPEPYVECCQYNMDVREFVTSAWVQEYLSNQGALLSKASDELLERVDRLKQSMQDVLKLVSL